MEKKKRVARADEEESLEPKLTLVSCVQKIYLGGLIDCCVFDTDWSVSTFDKTQNVFVWFRPNDIRSKNKQAIGVRDLGMFIKFLIEGNEQFSIEKVDDDLLMKMQNKTNKAAFTFHLANTNSIPVVPEPEKAYKDWMKTMTVLIDIDVKDFVSRYNHHKSLLAPQVEAWGVRKDGSVFCRLGETINHFITLELGKAKANGAKKAFEQLYMTSNTSRIFDVLSGDIVLIKFGLNAPLCVVEKSNYHSISWVVGPWTL